MQTNKLIVILTLLGALLASCGAPPATGEPTLDMNAIMTGAVGTFMAGMAQTQTAAALSQTATTTSTATPTTTPISLNSVTPLATSTTAFLPVLPFVSPTVTGTQYTPTVNPSTLGVGCNNLRLIRDETIPAGTVMRPGDTFTKTWKVENNGTCEWRYLYQLVFISGNAMDGVPSRSGNIIVPGQWTQLHVAMKAPTQPGTYTSNWRFADGSGTPFGATLTVSIVVANPTSTTAPTTYPNP
jgi:hypothetical protein